MRLREAQYLRELLKEEAGEDTEPAMLAKAHSWRARMLEPEDRVLSYDPDTGFRYVFRVASDAKYHRPPADPELRPREDLIAEAGREREKREGVEAELAALTEQVDRLLRLTERHVSLMGELLAKLNAQ